MFMSWLLGWLPVIIPVVIAFGLVIFLINLAQSWRRVVPVSQVHIVQRRGTSTSYGAGQPSGNVYWQFPTWMPVIGTEVVSLPISIFQIDLDEYEAYDQEKVPFAVDIISFFQIKDPVNAAKRSSDHNELRNQLQNVLRGAVRKILAGKDLNSIMETRSELNAAFLAEVSQQVDNWGVQVLSIEFTDIHDAEGTHVITDIMNRKKSHIEKESRIEVAENMRDAQLKEIEAKQSAQLRATEAEEAVQVRAADLTKKVGISQEKAKQDVQEEAKLTKTKEVAVARVSEVGKAEYERDRGVVIAEGQALAKMRTAEGEAKSVEITAEGYRASQVLKAEGDAKLIGETGKAEADVIQAKGFAAAEAALKNAEALAKIQKDGLQAQLGEKAIEAHRAIGIALADAYKNAEIKAILTQGGGIESLGELLSAGGGAKLATFVEALKKVSGGESVLEALGVSKLVPTVTKPASDAQ